MSTEDLIDEALFSASEGLPDYERFSYTINEVLKFDGKTLTEWQSEVALPKFNEVSSLQEQETMNKLFLDKCEIVSRCLSRAKSSYHLSKIHYRNNLLRKKDEIIRDIHAWNDNPNNTKKRVPGSDILHDMAKKSCLEIYTAYSIAKLFVEFWEVQHSKISMMNYRLSSMTTMKNIESKLGTY